MNDFVDFPPSSLVGKSVQDDGLLKIARFVMRVEKDMVFCAGR